MSAPAIDSHAHVFHRGLKLAEERRYAPAYDATIEAYLAMLDANAIAGGILVQPSFLGTDNSFLLQAIAAVPGRLRGVAVVDPTSGFDDLAALAHQGIVGLRANLIGTATPAFSAEPWRTLLRHATALGLHLEVQAEAHRLAGVLPDLLACADLAIVLDHFGLPDHAYGADDPALNAITALARQSGGRCWMKVSAVYRLGADGGATAAALVPRYAAAFGLDHLLFGTDWPHTRFEGAEHATAACASLAGWFPDAGVRSQVAGGNAAALCGWSLSNV